MTRKYVRLELIHRTAESLVTKLLGQLPCFRLVRNPEAAEPRVTRSKGKTPAGSLGVAGEASLVNKRYGYFTTRRLAKSAAVGIKKNWYEETEPNEGGVRLVSVTFRQVAQPTS